MATDQRSDHHTCRSTISQVSLLNVTPALPGLVAVRIHRESGRDLHPVPVPATMSFAPADATWISAAACSDRPWCEPSVRLFGAQIEKAARRGRGPSHAGEQRMVFDHCGIGQPGHQRGAVASGGQCSAGTGRTPLASKRPRHLTPARNRCPDRIWNSYSAINPAPPPT